METLSRDDSLRFLESADVAHLGVISDGRPYVTPMSFVVSGEKILFRTGPGRRLSAIGDNPSVSIEVSHFDREEGTWTSVIVAGTAVEAADETTSALTIEKLFEKYRKVLGSPLGRGGLQPLPTVPHVVVVTISEISGLTSRSMLGASMRPGRL